MNGEIKLPPGSPWDWVNLTDDQEMNLHFHEFDLGSKAPALQYCAVKQCRELKRNVESGDGFDTLTCIRLCAEHGLVIPDWLADAFKSKYDPVHNLQVGSWDDKKSFGRPYPAKTNLKATRKKFAKAGWIWLAIVERIENGQAVGDALFEDVGKQFFIEKTTVQKYYKYAKEDMDFGNVIGITDPQERELTKLAAQTSLQKWQSVGPLQLQSGARFQVHAPMLPRALRSKRGITKRTPNSSIKPSQPKGKLNDVSSVKPKPSRKTVKTSRS